MTVVVREADFSADMDAILYGAGEFAKLFNRPDLISSVENMNDAIRFLVGLPGVGVFLAESDGRCVGGLGFIVAPYIWDREKLACDELFWWCESNAPKTAALMLLNAFKRKVDQSGAKIFSLHRLMSSPEGVDKAYRWLGADPVQITHAGAV